MSLPSGGEWILIFLAILLLFGGKKIPELMRGLGKGIREFNAAKNNLQTELEEGVKEEKTTTNTTSTTTIPTATTTVAK